MPFKKRKEAKELRAKELNEVHVREEKQFDAAIQKAGQTASPARKILELNQISNNIFAQIQSEGSAITNEARSKEHKIAMAGAGTTVAAVITVGALVTGPVGWVVWPVLVGGFMGSDYLSEKRKDSVVKKLQKASSSHLTNMSGQRDVISAMIEATVEDNAEAISQSPLYGKVKALPGMADIFAEAAAKQAEEAAKLAETKAPPVAEEAPAAKEEPKNPPKKPANFDRITKVGKQF